MKIVKMKGKNVEEATKAALAVLGVEIEKVNVKIINQGKPAMLGVIGGEEAEVEVKIKESTEEEAKQILQNILDKMGFLAMIEKAEMEDETISISVKGEDMGRIIGKEGAMLKSLEVIVSSMLWKQTGERSRISIDAGGYKEKRIKALQRLAEDIAKEVEETGREKELPHMSATDRRIIHMYFKENNKVETFSTGEGAERKLVISPKKK
jgi:spoIIIJ-associated protein